MGDPVSKRFPGRRLSAFRLSVVVLVLALLGAGAAYGFGRFDDARTASAANAWFSGYVDVTATPYYAFESPETGHSHNAVLSFVVASPQHPCEPSWGAAYSLDEAAGTMDLDRRVARLVQTGGTVTVSFGGQLNSELGTACTDPDQLKAAYRKVLDRYKVTTIDVDLESRNLEDAAATVRRAAVLASLQQEQQAAGKELNIWLTLPVAPTGLTSAGTDAVAQLLSAKVQLAGVNIMTMDYGQARPEGQSMLQASVAAAEATHGQLDALYRQAGTSLGSLSLWRKIGLTPMIGQNDVAGEVFTLEDAAGLNAYARDKGVGRMSMWSMNRDTTCSSNYVNVTVVSDSCSGVDQQRTTYASALAAGLDGNPEQQVPPAVAETTATAQVTDDPATSPYPIWNETASYAAKDRIVWHGNVYAAKWWTRGDLPDNPVLQDAQTPWTLIGPVLPGDRPSPVVTAPAGLYPEWSPDVAYQKGDRVLFGGQVFEAKWWSRSDSPEAARQGSAGSPWDMFSNEDLEKLLTQHNGG
ncbi:MAG: glycosyl hydrolase family 18 [Micrococcaceae bacterium]|nr:glycosyl hydrolase family 18 [Micrococcaceae bacterium]